MRAGGNGVNGVGWPYVNGEPARDSSASRAAHGESDERRAELRLAVPELRLAVRAEEEDASPS